jgi:hypothetical protein
MALRRSDMPVAWLASRWVNPALAERLTYV